MVFVLTDLLLSIQGISANMYLASPNNVPSCPALQLLLLSFPKGPQFSVRIPFFVLIFFLSSKYVVRIPQPLLFFPT